MVATSQPAVEAGDTDPNNGTPPPAAPSTDQIIKQARNLVGANGDVFVQRLARFASLPSCSTAFSLRDDCRKAAELVQNWVLTLGGSCESVSIGYQEVANGTQHDLPPVLLASFKAGLRGGEKEKDGAGIAPQAGGAGAKATVCVYANYDMRQLSNGVAADALPKPPRGASFVSPTAAETTALTNGATKTTNGDGDGEGKSAASKSTTTSSTPLPFWQSKDGLLNGFGLSSGKASLMTWLWVIESYNRMNIPLPVNLKLVIEGMSSSASECIPDLIEREATKGAFLADVDYVVTSAGTFPAPSTPSVVYGTRGILSLDVQVVGGSKVISAGEFGGVVAEPMTDLVHLLAAISADNASGAGGVGVKACGRDAVEPPSGEESARANAIDASRSTLASLKAAAGDVPAFSEDDPRQVQLARTRFPSLSIHGIEGAYSGPGPSPAIYPAVSGKVSVRLGPGQQVKAVADAFIAALREHFGSLKSPNELTVTHDGADPWECDPESPLVVAVSAAVSKATGKNPVLARSGHTISALSHLEKTIGAPAVVVPLSGPVASSAGDTALLQDIDPIARSDYLDGIVVRCAVLSEIAASFEEEGGAESAAMRRQRHANASSGPLSRIKEIWRGLA